MTPIQKAIQRSYIAELIYRLDLEKNFFSLSSTELSALNAFKKLCNYNGKNYSGRSQLRQFYYHLQKGYKNRTK